MGDAGDQSVASAGPGIIIQPPARLIGAVPGQEPAVELPAIRIGPINSSGSRL
jgi:hypothetical protein